MTPIPPVSAGAAAPSGAAHQAASPQAPASAETPTELAGAPGVENCCGEFSGQISEGNGLQGMASALLLALLLGGKEGEDDDSSTAKLMLGLAALAMLAPQNNASISFQGTSGHDAQQAYGQAAGVAPTTGANINTTA